MTENKSIIDLAMAGRKGAAESTSVPVSARPPKESNTEHHDVLKKLLEKVESKIAWAPLELPSRGVFSASHAESIQIRPFTFEDEKILRSINKLSDADGVIVELIKRCTKGLEYDGLPLVDKNYILYKLREISYGDSYKIEVPCPDCSAPNELIVNLSQLPVNFADRSAERNYEITLPDSEVTVKYRVPTTLDEKYLQSPASMMDNLWKLLVSIDGHTERIIVQGFVSKTTAKDISHIRNAILNDDLGIQTKVGFICNGCSSDSRVDLPINESFFNVN